MLPAISLVGQIFDRQWRRDTGEKSSPFAAVFMLVTNLLNIDRLFNFFASTFFGNVQQLNTQ